MNDSLDDLLDARLRDEASYIDDAGFTARVVQKLPAQRHSPRMQRALIILLAAIVSVVVAFFASGEGSFVRESFNFATKFPPRELMLAAIACGVVSTAAAMWAALSRGRDPLA
ncbi:MAG: hypothetical protein M3R59_05035 [Verrucomicrobiota bacterium]|nr:hypothetical protein [Verrucomicrobiota bacterium]